MGNTNDGFKPQESEKTIRIITKKVLPFIETHCVIKLLLINSTFYETILRVEGELFSNIHWRICEHSLPTKFVFKTRKKDSKGLLSREKIDEELQKLSTSSKNTNIEEIKEMSEKKFDISVSKKMEKMGVIIDSITNSMGSNRYQNIFEFSSENKLNYVSNLTLEKNVLINFREVDPGFFQNVKSIKIHVSNLQKSQKLYQSFPNLQRMIIYAGFIDSKTIIPIRKNEWAKFIHLKSLEFYSCSSIREDMLQHLSNIQELKIVAPLPRFQRISKLLLKGVDFHKLINLKSLEIMYCNFIKDMFVKKIQSNVFTNLIIVSCEKIDGSCLRFFKHLKRLVLMKNNNLKKKSILEIGDCVKFVRLEQNRLIEKRDVLEYMKTRIKKILKDITFGGKNGEVVEIIGEELVREKVKGLRDSRIVFEKKNFRYNSLVTHFKENSSSNDFTEDDILGIEYILQILEQ